MNKSRRLALLLALYICGLSASEASAWYAPHLGRFITRDPAGQIHISRVGMEQSDTDATLVGRSIERDDFEPMINYDGGMNLHQYVGSKPTIHSDPSGLIPPGWDSPRPGIGLPGTGFPSPTPGGGSFGGWGVQPSNAGDLYCYYLTPGNSASADPWYLNWGSEAGFVTGGLAGGAAALGPEVVIMREGCFKIICRTIKTGIRRDPAHHGKPHGHWHFWRW
jgi:hypothetical protein